MLPLQGYYYMATPNYEGLHPSLMYDGPSGFYTIQ